VIFIKVLFNDFSYFKNLKFLYLKRRNTVKTGVFFRRLLRHINSASKSVVAALKSVCISVKTTENDTPFILTSVGKDSIDYPN
jgi:hypothetical protein